MKQPKFFLFRWAGNQAPLKSKVAANAIKTSVQMYFSVSTACCCRRNPPRRSWRHCA